MLKVSLPVLFCPGCTIEVRYVGSYKANFILDTENQHRTQTKLISTSVIICQWITLVCFYDCRMIHKSKAIPFKRPTWCHKAWLMNKHLDSTSRSKLIGCKPTAYITVTHPFYMLEHLARAWIAQTCVQCSATPSVSIFRYISIHTYVYIVLMLGTKRWCNPVGRLLQLSVFSLTSLRVH